MQNEICYGAYAVKILPNGEKQRVILSMTDIKQLAINRIRDAIASGYDYGYIKQGTDCIASFNEQSFLRLVK